MKMYQTYLQCGRLLIRDWALNRINAVFEEGKTREPGEPLEARMRTNNKLSLEHEPHWWDTSALTTAPSLLPMSNGKLMA